MAPITDSSSDNTGLAAQGVPLAERAAGGLLALACGDALANGEEYSPRHSYTITGMDSGPRFLPVGQWSDDTGQALCLADSLLVCDGFDAADQMARYVAFYEGKAGWPLRLPMTPGPTTARALKQFQVTGDPFSGSADPLAAGNGGLMRLLPVVLAAYPDEQRAREWARESTRTTHAAPECLEASEVLAMILHSLLDGTDKRAALAAGATARWKSPRIQAIAEGQYVRKGEALIKAKAYVVDTLEAALWCFSTYDTLTDAVLGAANLGDDCDTVAAVTGQLAGCHFGSSAIPHEWLAVLHDREAIARRAHRLISRAPMRGPTH